MKKIITLIFLLLFLLVVSPSSAQENITTSSAESLVSSSEATIDYQLPYPGLLPDNPLYVLKSIRDRVVSFLISDPLKKAEFDLLAADKRVNVGLYTFNKGKYDLAESTISKGENYFEESIKKTEEAKKQGMVTIDMGKKLYQAAKKHKEVIKNMEEKAPNGEKQAFSNLLKRVSYLENEAKLLIPN